MVRMLLNSLSAQKSLTIFDSWKPRSKKSNPSENKSPPERGALEASTESRESKKEPEGLPTVREFIYIYLCPPFAHPSSSSSSSSSSLLAFFFFSHLFFSFFRAAQQQQHQIMRPTPKSEETTHNADSFEDFYLQQITREFADDIDKIRTAGDFTEKSLPVLVAALKQGATIYTEEERRDWGAGAMIKK